MGSVGKLVSGIFLLIVGIFIAYEAYINTLKEVILVVGLVISIVGIIIIFSFIVDSSLNKSNSFFKEYVKKLDNSAAFSFNPGGNERSLNKSGKDYSYDDDYDDYYPDTDSDYYFEEDDWEPVDDTATFGESLNFTPHYDKPVKITRAPKKRERRIFEEDFYRLPTPDKSESIKRALKEDNNLPEPTPDYNNEVRDIKIDINNPEALPIPKDLNSYIVDNGKIITSQDAFDKLGSNIKKEVMLEIPSLNDLSDRFLSHIPAIYSRVIIEDFDASNISYMILVASLLKQGVHIKTMPKVNTINLITDDSKAIILSKGRKTGDVEYGAVYDDRNVLSEIRTTFDKTWDMAKDLDENILLKYIGQGAS